VTSTRKYFAKIEFYITNVCNLTCNHCNRFNNHNFKGWQKWADYEQIYRSWSQYIDIDHMVILGGEPLLNPTIVDWMYGLNDIWHRNVQVLSNGTHINHVRGLKQALQKNGNWLGISWHNVQQLDQLRDIMAEFLGSDYQEIHGKLNNRYGGDIVFGDKNGLQIPIYIQDQFQESSIRTDWTLHNSDPIVAHERCGFAQNKNYHFIKGKLYKCGPVALIPEFDQQHALNISHDDRQLLHQYQPLTIDDAEQKGEEFFHNLDMPISQCKFCPVEIHVKKIYAIRKNV
jgi:hypothetical protein